MIQYDSAELIQSGLDKNHYASVRLIKDQYALTDYDGNAYATIIIGTQEWIVQNLRVTHYSDGTIIQNLINNLGAELITGWTNVAAPIDALAGSACFSNVINPMPNAILYFYINITINAFDPPYLWVQTTDGGGIADYIYPLTAGVNIFIHSCSVSIISVIFRIINYDFLLFPGVYHAVDCGVDLLV
jgi:hypothetical protein